MKRNLIQSFLLGTALMLSFSACDDWLDISPKSQIEEEDHFSREGGFRDQLTGVYTRMSSASMYKQNMGIGFTEVLSQNYSINANSSNWYYPSLYDYTQKTCESTIKNIWSNTYSCISNLNLLLQNIDKVDRSIFSNNNYYLCKGEALGLRAFLHFELMRLFASAPSMDNNAKGVPYVTKYDTEVVTQKTVKETMGLIVNDLLEAKTYLDHDSLKIGSSPYRFRSSRQCYFNYYAVIGTLARAYMWMGDTQNALTYANEIIDTVTNEETNSYPFNWIHYTNMQQSEIEKRDIAFSTEHLFQLRFNDWDDISDLYFRTSDDDITNGKTNTELLNPSEIKAKEIFEYSSGYGNDYRYLHGFENEAGTPYLCKYWYHESGTYNGLYAVLRMTEAFYIAAECLKSTNSSRAIELLNLVRENRGLSLYPLSENLNPTQIQEEIFKEYRKEFLAEGGQLFFYYKRLNASEIKDASVRPGKNVYVLPIPSNDVEFGGYEN